MLQKYKVFKISFIFTAFIYAKPDISKVIVRLFIK